MKDIMINSAGKALHWYITCPGNFPEVTFGSAWINSQ